MSEGNTTELSDDCHEPHRAWIRACVPLWAVFVITFSVVMLSIAGTTLVLFLIHKLTTPNVNKTSIKQTFTMSSRRQQPPPSKNAPPGNSVLLMPESASIKPPARCPRRTGSAPQSPEPKSGDSIFDGRHSPATTPRNPNGDDTSTDLPPNEPQGPIVHEYHDPDDYTPGKKDTTENSVEKPKSVNQQPTDDRNTMDLLRSDLLKSKQHLTGTKLISVKKESVYIAKK
uniref:CLLAC domain-containing protein n=1 Tax=Panagrellus redivivus TaxID=6233 RepID=A0A7E4ZRL7_PANRE